jgi:uncharacterized protein YqeY
MSLIERVQQEQVEARKRRDKVAGACLTALLSEARMVGKNAGDREPTDAEVVQVVRKSLKSAHELLEAAGSAGRDTTQVSADIRLLETFLPQQMTEEEIRTAAKEYIEELGISEPKQMGQVMGMLKKNHPGEYDGKTASQVVRDLLT